MGRLGFLVGILSATLGCGRMGFDDQVTPIEQCTLALDAGGPRLNYHSQRAIQIVGGTDPIELAITGPATIDAVGVVSALAASGTATITATDAGGCTAQASLEIGGASLWYVAGSSMTVPSPQVWRSDDGLAWSNVGSLPDKRTSGALLVFHDQLWWITGSDGVGNRDEVFSSADGVTWTLAGHVPKAGANSGHAVFHDKMWIIGGAASPDTDNVYSSSDGATWTLAGHLPNENHGGSAVVMNDKLWYLGGHSNTDGLLFDWVLSSAEGVTWQQVGTLPSGREYAAAFVYDTSIVVTGGQDLSAVKTTSVVETANGAAFTALPALPVARAFGAIAKWRGEAWAVGGSDGGAVFRGTLGTGWISPTTNFPVPRQGGRLAVFTAP